MICIIGAMKEEVDALLALMSNVEEKENDIVIGDLNKEKVLLATSGVGKVNAAITSANIINKYNPKFIINIGSAGGLLENQAVGDIVVANKLQYHDFDIGENTVNDERFIFYTDKDLMSKLNTVLDNLNIKADTGLMVSGDQFILKHMPQFKRIQEVFPSAHCVEMEASAIAHVCSRENIPFIVMRSLSDVVNVNDGMQFDEYLPIAAKNSALICSEFIKYYNEN